MFRKKFPKNFKESLERITANYKNILEEISCDFQENVEATLGEQRRYGKLVVVKLLRNYKKHS